MYATHQQSPQYGNAYDNQYTTHDGSRYGGSGYAASTYTNSNANYNNNSHYGGHGNNGYTQSDAGTVNQANRYGRDASYEGQHTNTNSLLNKGPVYNPVVDPDTVSIRSKEGKTRYCCGCFGSRRACWGTFCGCFLILLAAIGVTIFFLFPRIPTVNTGDPYVPSGEVASRMATQFDASRVNTNFTYQAGPRVTGTLAERSLNLTMGLAIDISVASENYIDIKLTKIKGEGQLLDTNGAPITMDKIKVDAGLDGPTFYKHTTTNITVPVLFSYGMARTLTADDTKVLSVLQSVCGGNGGSFRMLLDVDLTIDLIKWLPNNKGTIPLPQRTISFPCPADLRSAITSLIQGQLPTIG
ncbi:hypothetical protein HK097_000070 [Rhizophlyctis rosea]|uniref:Uncharacterized protein n=1 Tax=Rhizophlyctis rosea TaxID=64517 RepID=A0AAD5X8R7_9FUNG|nr:hypothetical protein HK097_000070 [Rhizophlyctis rosea]